MLRSFYFVCAVAFFLSSCTSPISNDVLQSSDGSVPSSEKASSNASLAPGNGMAEVGMNERFTKHVLVDNLNEPTEFEVLKDGSVLFIQRRGTVMLLDSDTGKPVEVAKLDVNTKFEDGLMGLALDPNYDDNHWIYLYYSPASTHPDAEEEDYVPTEEESRQHLSRFVYKDGVLDLDSEKLMLVVQTQRIECCHTGGSIEFGPDGNLFLSTGDDVNPFASDGFGPFDEQDGRSPWDGQTTSANTNDLRGKILRITPQPDGTYTIPDGNLFPVGTEKTRPEIYVMGNRNPYRISIDQKTGYLYWGEVGPDAQENNPDRGPRGHDEINQARQAGNYGWPLFVADNKAYNDYNFATKESGPPYDPMAPINDSPNNTGLRELPPAKKAFIWYPYAESPEFPVLGSGGRNAMAGPVFYKDAYNEGPHSFPAEFDGRLFIYDWIRGWIMTVTMDENSDLKQIYPFMPDVEFSNPIDMQFDQEGVLYVMEYGKGWFSQNKDARISRIEYNPAAEKTAKVVAAVEKTEENTSPVVEIHLDGNQSFFFDGEVRSYSVAVSDAEDGRLEEGQINAEEVLVQLDYLPMGYDKTLIAQGHQMADEAKERAMKGKNIMDNSDCAGCHALDRMSIGPTYKQVAEKYGDDPNARTYLKDKIQNGGGGVWGEQVMAAHPQFSENELDDLVTYILSVNDKDGDNLGVSGSMTFSEHLSNESKEGTYFIRASYTDQGAKGSAPSTSEASLALRHPLIQAESFDVSEGNAVHLSEGYVSAFPGAYISFKDLDLTGISSLTYALMLSENEYGGTLELRIGNPEGDRIGQLTFDEDTLGSEEGELSMPIETTSGNNDVYVVFQHDRISDKPLFGLDWIQFKK